MRKDSFAYLMLAISGIEIKLDTHATLTAIAPHLISRTERKSELRQPQGSQRVANFLQKINNPIPATRRGYPARLEIRNPKCNTLFRYFVDSKSSHNRTAKGFRKMAPFFCRQNKEVAILLAGKATRSPIKERKLPFRAFLGIQEVIHANR